MMRPDLALRLAELLATRLCHDMSGAVGTVVGSLELAAEDAEGAGEAVSLAGEAATALSSRLRLLRTAWGSTGGPLPGAELAALADGLPARHRFTLDFSGLEDSVLPAGTARTTLAALIVAAESLPLGGRVTFGAAAAHAVTVTVEGKRVAWPEMLKRVLADPMAALETNDNPRDLAAPLLGLIAAQAQIAVSLQSNTLTIAPRM